MDDSEIRIRELKIFARHGVYKEENEKGQNFYVNATLFQDTYEAGKRDELCLSTNYGEVCLFIKKWMDTHICKLIEAVCEQLAEAILIEFPLVEAIELEIRKPEAPIPMEFGSVSVAIKRSWHVAYLSVGSNMGDRHGFLEQAFADLNSQNHTKILDKSQIITTEPYGGVAQDDFLNAAVKIKTMLSPVRLLAFLHEIEKNAGRERSVRWGPRTLDLDIVFYDSLVYEDDELIIPHVDMENREFVLKPLCEIAPNYRHPLLKRTVSQLLQELRS